jgi:hypothetical protein
MYERTVCTKPSEKPHLWLGKWILHHQKALSYTTFLLDTVQQTVCVNTSVSVIWTHVTFMFLKQK